MKKTILFTFSIILLLTILAGCKEKDTTRETGIIVSKTEEVVDEETGTAALTAVDDNDTVIETTESATMTADDEPKETAEDTVTPESTFVPSSPISEFTQKDIEYLGVDVSGTDREIAEGIRRWQNENMLYAFPDSGLVDASDPIRWNYFLPGIWTSKDIIYTHVKDGKVYGVCHDFAVIYCSIANYYGLETRVMNTLSKPSDSWDTPALPGMDRTEYDRNKFLLERYNLNYSYDAISSVAEETPTHYWAEVYLDGAWVVMDGSQSGTGGNTQTEFKDTGDYEITDWLSRDRTSDLQKFTPVNTRDDLGQTDRAGSIGEVMTGEALAPYFNDVFRAISFNGAAAYFSASDVIEMSADKADYESCSGRHLYLVSYMICDGEGLQGQAWADRYFETCGEELDMACAADFISGD